MHFIQCPSVTRWPYSRCQPSIASFFRMPTCLFVNSMAYVVDATTTCPSSLHWHSLYYRVPNISGISFIFFDHQTYLNQRRICLQNFTMDRELENQIRFLFNLSLKAEVCQCLKSLTKQTWQNKFSLSRVFKRTILSQQSEILHNRINVMIMWT